MLVEQVAGGTVHWYQLPVYLGGELLAGALAALAYTVISRTPADAVPAPGIDLADPEPAVASATNA